MTHKIQQQKLRPICLACRTATDRANAITYHPPGEETQWDDVDLPKPPPEWGWGRTAHLWVDSLAHSCQWRAVRTPSKDQPHLVDDLDRISRALGGVTWVRRFDRMPTVCYPGSGAVTASCAGVAKYYGSRYRSALRGQGTAKLRWESESDSSATLVAVASGHERRAGPSASRQLLRRRLRQLHPPHDLMHAGRQKYCVADAFRVRHLDLGCRIDFYDNMSDTPTPRTTADRIPAPNTAEAASHYQCLRRHLGVLELADAAGVDTKLIDEPVTCRYLETATNVLLIGPPGVGKTHLSVGPARAAAHAGYRTYFTTAADDRRTRVSAATRRGRVGVVSGSLGR